MLITSLFIFLSIANAQNAIEQRVNEHLIETSKKIEIDGQKKSTELQKDYPKYLEYNPPSVAKKKQPFVVVPPKPDNDPNIYRDQYDHPTFNDPETQVQEDVQYQRDVANDIQEQEKSREEFVRKFQENAAKAGVKVKVDPKTLKAHPETNY
jgi:hypothetical protein